MKSLRSGMTLAVALALVAPSVATAQTGTAVESPVQEAKRLYGEGKLAYAEGRYEDAIKQFERAFELTGKALLLYNLALAYERVGDYKKALESLRGYMAAAPPEELEIVKKRIQNLKKRVEAQEQGEQESLEKERLELELERERLEKARLEQERLEAEREAAAAEAASGEQRPQEPEGPNRLPAYLTLGGGGLILVGSAVLGGLALAARDEASALCADNGLCQTAAREPMIRDQNLSIAFDVTLGVGLAAVGVGLFLLFYDFGPPAVETGAEVAPAAAFSFAPLVDGGAAFAVRGSF